MDLSVAFKLSLYGLTALAAYILGRAEEGWIPFATFPVLIVAYLLIEYRGGRSLSPGWANFCGMLAVAAAGWEFSTPGPESKLLAGAHLLVYSTWIVMFQEKTYRLYWWVMALGVLQVAVASVLQPGPWYGLSLMIYVCAALATMSIASLFQVQQQFASGHSGWKWNAHDELPTTAAVLVRPTVQYDETHRWLTRKFFGGLLLLIVMSLSVSAAFFTFTPRVWFGPRNIFGDEMLAAPNRRQSQTGFAREVRLGEMGEILESVALVFTVRCTDARTGQPVSLQSVAERMGTDEPLFRGTVMTEYDRGRWYPERNDQPVKVGRVFNRAGVAQEVTLEPTTEEILFCVGSPEAVEIAGSRKEDAYLQLATGVLSRERRPESKQRLQYTAYVSYPPGELSELGAAPVPQGLLWRNVDPAYLRRNTRIQSENLPTVREVSEARLQALRERLGRPPTNREVGKDFEFWLRDSGEFGYTLSLAIVDPTVDPIEDFLRNRREGHCEYFASTLALMLRSVDIPARLVSGFKGAEPNTLRGTWEVQERFAHAWVEVWSQEHQLWLTLDPTPGLARTTSLETVSSRLGFWGRLRASSTSAWQDYVVNVSLQQQQDSFYGPAKEFFEKLVGMLRRVTSSWREFWNSLVYVLTHPSEWLSVTGGAVTFILLLVLTLAVRGVRRSIGWLRERGWWPTRTRKAQTRIAVAFYQRFVKIARLQGWKRQSAQTPAEFADMVSRQLQTLPLSDGLVQFPHRIAQAFYRVRFGGEALTPGETQSLEQSLQELEQQLRQGPGSAAPAT